MNEPRLRAGGAAQPRTIGQPRPAALRHNTSQRDVAPAGVAGTGRMQPPPHLTLPPPRGDEAELYRLHHRNLQRAVARAVPRGAS